MKNYLSVTALASRGTLFKILGILLVMTALQIGMFYHTMGNGTELPLFETLIAESHIQYVFIAGFILAVIQPFLFFARKGGAKSGYTLSRLSVKETHVSVMFALYNLGCIITVWAGELLAVIIMGQMYIHANTGDPYSPVLFLAFYRSPFLHGLLPLSDRTGNVANILMFITLAMTLSVAELKMRRGKIPVQMFLYLAIFAVSCNRPLGNGDSMLALYFAIIVFGINSAYRLWKGYEEDDDEPTETETPASAINGGDMQ